MLERKQSTRELALRLRDELNKGIKYDRKLNLYVVVWTPRQLRNARRRAKRILSKLRIE